MKLVYYHHISILYQVKAIHDLLDIIWKYDNNILISYTTKSNAVNALKWFTNMKVKKHVKYKNSQ